MKNKLLLLFFILISINLFSQVIISPEIGYNYRPYILGTTDSNNSEMEHDVPEFYVAVNGDIRLTNKYSLQAKVGYVFRNNNNVPYIAFDIANGITFVNQDLLLNIGLLYAISSNFKAGIGGGFYHKLNSHIISETGPGIRRLYRINRNILFNTHFQLVYSLYKNIKIMTMYQFLFDSELPPPPSLLSFVKGHHAFSVGISYDLVKSKHSK